MTETVNLLSREMPESSLPSHRRENRKPSLRYADSWQDIVATAMSDDIELVLWKRNPHVSSAIIETRPTSDFEIIMGQHGDILGKFTELFEVSAWPQSLEKIVAQDVQNFLDAFEAKVPNAHYRLRLQAVSDDACRKFHQDRTFQRLIITYRGNGTVWRYADSPIENKAIERECVLLRGKRNGREAQILHKSPVFIEGHPPRLIMVIDVIDDGSAL